MTIVGFAIYGNRIASLFENATHLHVFSGKEGPIDCIKLEFANHSHRIDILKKAKVDALVCGGISWDVALNIENASISLFPWVSGNIEDALKAVRCGNLDSLLMPGCHKHRKRWERCWSNKRFKGKYQ